MIIKKLFILSLPVLLFACGQDKTHEPREEQKADTTAAAPDTTKKKGIHEYEMKTFYMVFLNKGAKRDQDSATAAKLQEEHLAHLTKMANEGKLLIAGPFLDEGNTRGICIYDAASLEEAKGYAEADPAVKAGRLSVEVRPWMSDRNAKLK
jgi:uncharacterized protein